MCSVTICMSIGLTVDLTAGVSFIAVDGSLARSGCPRNTRVDGGGCVVGVRGSRSRAWSLLLLPLLLSSPDRRHVLATGPEMKVKSLDESASGMDLEGTPTKWLSRT